MLPSNVKAVPDDVLKRIRCSCKGKPNIKTYYCICSAQKSSSNIVLEFLVKYKVGLNYHCPLVCVSAGKHLGVFSFRLSSFAIDICYLVLLFIIYFCYFFVIC